MQKLETVPVSRNQTQTKLFNACRAHTVITVLEVEPFLTEQ